jgi:hypothetical protein
MKRSRNFITLFLAICTFFVTQALAAQQEVDKTHGVQTQKDEKAATTPEQSQTGEKPSMEQADRVTKIIG